MGPANLAEKFLIQCDTRLPRVLCAALTEDFSAAERWEVNPLAGLVVTPFPASTMSWLCDSGGVFWVHHPRRAEKD